MKSISQGFKIHRFSDFTWIKTRNWTSAKRVMYTNMMTKGLDVRGRDVKLCNRTLSAIINRGSFRYFLSVRPVSSLWSFKSSTLSFPSLEDLPEFFLEDPYLPQARRRIYHLSRARDCFNTVNAHFQHHWMMADLKNLALAGGGASRYSGDEQVQFIPGGSHQVTIRSPPPALHLENLNNAVHG